jgi:Secretion system C-terminal sorting domain/Ig-like domain CHU_C associated
MKTKNILIITIITAIIFLSGSKGLGQCVEQTVVIDGSNLLNICNGYTPSCLVTIYLEQDGSDYIFNPVQLKRPNGSVAIGISPASATYVSESIVTYTIDGGYFNIVGNWTLAYSTMSSCTNPINKTVPITVYGFTGNTIGSDQAICTGSGTPFPISNISLSSNSGYSIIWQYSDNGFSWNTITGATSTTYQPTIINKTTRYKRIATTTTLGCPSTSNIVTKSVYDPFVPGVISGNQNNCYDITPSELTQISAATGGSLTYNYQWYVSTDGTSFSVVSGATSVNYQPVFQQGLRYFKRRDYDASCGDSYTNPVTVQGFQPFSPGTITADQTICYNITPGLLSVGTSASGGSGTYTYQWEVSSDGSNFGDVTSATGTVYQPPALPSNRWYRLKVINSCETKYTNSVKITVHGPLNPGTITANQTICYNTIANQLNVGTSASGGSGTYTYQWEVSTDGSSFGDVSSATGTSYQPTALPSNRWYRLRVINSCETGHTNSVKITVHNSLNPGTITADQTICYNTVPSMLNVGTVATGGSGTYTYQWQFSSDGSSFGNISSATGTVYQPPALPSNRWYRLRVINSCETGYTNSVKITVHSPLSPGTITADQTICYNTVPSILNVGTSATGGSGTYTYQWEVSSDGSSFGDVASATGTVYQPPALPSNRWYRLKIINSCETDYTNAVKITVHSPLSPGTITAAQTICYNTIANQLNVGTVASGGSGTYSYQWEVSSDGSSFGDVASATGTVYQPPALPSNRWYRLKVINSCETGYTNSVKITVHSPLSPGTITADQTICYNSSPGILSVGSSATGGSGTYTYQWEVSSDGSSFGDVASATSTVYQPPALPSNRWYRLKVINSCETGYTNSVMITVHSQFDPGTITSDQTVCYNITPSMITTGTLPTGGSGTYAYQWEKSIDGSNWDPIIGSTNENLQPGSLVNTTFYRRNVINTCASSYSNTVIITVLPNIVPGVISQTQTICYNTAPLTLISFSYPTGAAGSFSFQWQNSINNSIWNDIPGATDETYQPGVMNSSLYFRRLETSGACMTVQTNSVQISVNSPLVAGSVKTDQSICNGISPNMFLTDTYPNGGTGSYFYQWQKLVATAWTDIMGVNSETYTPEPLTTNSYFRRSETSGTCGTVYTNQITVTVHDQFLPGVIGSSQTVNFGAIPAELVSVQPASGGAGTFVYQWQNSLDNSTWSNITDANSESFQPPALSVTKYYKRVTTDGSCGTIETNIITINVNSSLVPGVINDNQTICYNTTPDILTTLAPPSGGNGIYAYQWQKTEDGINWTDITAANSDNYQSGALIQTTYFRKKVTSVSFEDYSNIVTIVVSPAFDAGVIGSDQAVCKTYASAPITTTVLPTGESIQNLWQISDNNASWDDITGATNDYYDAGVLTASKYFRKKVTGSCSTGYTNSIKIIVYDEFQGGTIGIDQAIAYNTSPSLLTGTLPTGGSGTFTYQWYYSVNNIDWQVVITDGDGKDYQPGVLSQKTYFKRKVADGSCGEVYSNTVIITVFDSLFPGVVGDAQSICYNTAPTLLSGTSPEGGTGQYSYQWQYSLQGITWVDIPSEVGISYKPDVLNVNAYYRRAVTSGNSTVYSNFVMIKVYDQVSLPVTDLKTSYCKGSTVNINVVNPAYLSYKWFDSGHAYLMDGTKYTLNSITTDNTVFVKSLNLNGCLSDYQEQKIIVDNVKANFIQDITTVTLGDPIKFTSTSVNASGYTWNFFEGDIITETNPVHYYNTLGENSKKFGVKLIVSSPGGCVDSLFLDEIITVVNDVTGIEKNNEVTFTYFPNPVKEKLSLRSSRKIETVKIFNSSGKMIESLIFDNDLVFVDFSSFKSGIYFLEINGLSNSRKIIKIIKQ